MKRTQRMRDAWLHKGGGWAVLALLAWAAACWTAPVAKADTTVVSILDATGGLNIYGIPMIDATRMAIESINARGGVLGQKLHLVEYDGQSTNDKYVQYANQAILSDKAAVIMGGITSGSREAIRPVMDRSNQLYFYNEQYEGGVCDKNVFNTGVVPEQQIAVLIPWAIKNAGPRLYVIAADYNYGHISADWVKVYAGKSGGQVVGTEFIPLDVAEFSSTLSKIQEAKPSAIVSLLVGGNHIAFYRQWAAAGLKKTYPVFSPTFGLGNEQVVLAPNEAEGIVVAYPYFQELNNQENRRFVEAWHKRFGKDYPYVTDSANVVWAGWHLWAEAVNKAKSLDHDKVIAALESGLTFNAPEGKVRLDAQTHHLVHNVHVAKVNSKKGFDIISTMNAVVPSWHREVCNLIKNPETQKQFTPAGG